MKVVLAAPMDGWLAPLEEVPDRVFADKILGDGLAIDPTGESVFAPCDGTVALTAKHGVTIRAANGAEILIHVGLETVALKGEGFKALVADGARVKTGEPLLSFDLDFLATHAKSVLSPIVVANGDLFRIVRRSVNQETKAGAFMMEIEPVRTVQPAESAQEGRTVRRELTIGLAHGIHARPAAAIAAAAKVFASEIVFGAGTKWANAKSTVALMTLGLGHGDVITLSAAGPDAAEAADAIAKLVLKDLPSLPEEGVAAPAAVSPRRPAQAGMLGGVTAAPGIAYGFAFRLRAADLEVEEAGKGIAHEAGALEEALSRVRARIARLAQGGSRQRKEILSAHISLLEDPELSAAALALVREGKSAGFAWRGAIRAQARALDALKDERLKARVQDLLDIERQVLSEITGAAPAAADLPPDSVLIAQDILPSELVSLDASKIAGICTAAGGPTSHVAILAAGMNVPALVSLGAAVFDIADGTPLLLDASEGELTVNPDAQTAADFKARVARDRERQAEAQSAAQQPCRTADGTRIEVFANLGAGSAEAQAAVEQGAEGCGLLRTEFLFLDRETAPGEDEQTAAYQAVADGLAGRPLIVRTFDIGADKPAAFVQFPPEENPALGLRGVRAAFRWPELLRTQLSAILRVRPVPQIMLPMVASVSELEAVRAILADVQRERGLTFPVALGVMIETPSAALLADQLARQAEFLSVGTNDLTQYALAMDRTNAQLAPQIDSLHPAVLRLIAEAAEGAQEHGRPIGVCGALAADLAAVPLLIGLGIGELSVPSPAIPGVKALIRRLNIAECRAAARRALDLDSAQAVRAYAAKMWSDREPAGAIE